MSDGERRCPEEGCEDNRDGICMNPAVVPLGLAAGAYFPMGMMGSMAPYGPMGVLPLAAAMDVDGGILGNCPRRREKNLKE